MQRRTVVLVDEDNRPIGTEEVVAAHTGEGKLHRAFSVYVFRNSGKEILIQKRSTGKMLWPGIWANTCCSHPLEGEGAVDAGKRRLQEELGFTCDLNPVGSFIYRAVDPRQRGVEHEHVTILLGALDLLGVDLSGVDVPIDVRANPEEVAQWKWVGVEDLQKAMHESPLEYAPWFHLGMKAIRELRRA